MTFYVGPCLFYYVVWLSMEFSGCVDTAGRPIMEFDIGDTRRPIWNIAHMVNAAYQVDYYMSEGANSIEFDITFDDAGNSVFTYHGLPCDCFRSCTRYENIVEYIKYVKEMTTPGTPQYRKELGLLFLDLKLSKLSGQTLYRAGTDIATKLLEHYWQNGNSGAGAYVLLSMPSTDHVRFIEGYRNHLIKEGFSRYLNITGFDFSGNEDLDAIGMTYRKLNIGANIWQGDGITNCLPRGTRRLRECLWRRDNPQQGNYNIDKVYWWTVDKMSTMRSVLRLGVDGILTNYPDRLVRVLAEDEFSKRFRMATVSDNPFKKFAPMSSLRVSGKSHMMARGGNIGHMKSTPDNEDGEELLDNREPPDEEHLRMELDPPPARTPRLRF